MATSPRQPSRTHAFVVPAYKDSPFLADCLASLRAQTGHPKVLISTSTPCAHIAQVAANFGVPVVVNQSRRGIGADWNFALSAADARYVTLAHQDDIYAARFLEGTCAAFARQPGATLAFTGCRQIDDAGRPRTSRISVVKDMLLSAIAGRRESLSGLRARLLLSFGNPISCSSITFDTHGLAGFKFSEDLASNLDWQAWVTLIGRGDAFAYCPERLISRRYNEQTETSRLIKDGRRRAEDEMMFAQLWPKPVARMIARAYASGY